MRPTKPRLSEFGRHLATLREEQGYTVTELAYRAGISAPYLSQLETGKKTPTDRTIRALSGPLGIHPSELHIRAGLLTLPWEGTLTSSAARHPRTLEVTEEEWEHLWEYLQFLRFRRSRVIAAEPH
ncbi:MAG: helix-turn-helix transcriptional regulator [Chloroflexi bacterium]|nr:helix-turn-helix transcriptional regulator [Chloroflexota bacterium]